MTAGKLLLAAEEHKDENLLLQICGIDLVASEAMYHFRCYRNYTVFLYKKDEHDCTGNKQFQTGYNHFCTTVVEERLLKKRKVFKLSKLNALFKKCVSETEGIDISSYKSSSLKIRLQKSYPFLTFQKLSRHDFVYVEDLTPHEVVQDEVATAESSFSPPSSSSSSSDEDDTRTPETDDTRLLYHAAMTLKDDIVDKCKTTPKLRWPPTAQQLTMSAASNLIPNNLFNFIAWSTAMTTDPSTDNKRVNVSEEESAKVVSICQDVMRLTMKGRWIMPKHCALAMAVRHMTGSAQLIGLLNGLGHCSSNSQVLEHDTALAHLQIQRGDTYLPQNIQVQMQATLVWDNNDFGEETLSGKGTTHNTNGIIIQKMISCNEPTPENQCLQKTRKRSLDPPSTHLEIYIRGKRTGPEHFGK